MIEISKGGKDQDINTSMHQSNGCILSLFFIFQSVSLHNTILEEGLSSNGLILTRFIESGGFTWIFCQYILNY